MSPKPPLSTSHVIRTEAWAKTYGVPVGTVLSWSPWWVDKHGYVVRIVEYQRIGKQVRRFQSQHRVVWENAHGALLKGQTLRHKNGDRTDNRLSNLELWDTHPQTRRVVERLDGARAVFERYARPGEVWVKL